MAGKMLTMPYPFSLEEEMKKCPSLKASDMKILGEWCERQAHLPKIPDLYLAAFLHSSYYSTEAAKTTIENYFSMRTHIPEIFAGRDPLGSKELRKAFKVGSVVKVPKETKEGYSVYYGRYLDTDPSHFFLNDAAKFFFMVNDLAYLKNPTRPGFVFVGDCVGMTLGYLARLNPLTLKKIVYYMQEAVPIRLKSIHFVNAPPVMEMILNMAKPFMSKELISLIHIHTSLNSLPEFVPIDLLPDDLGGTAGDMYKLHAECIKELEDNREWFLQEEAQLRVNESLRVGKSKSANALFGVDGSFKKLEID